MGNKTRRALAEAEAKKTGNKLEETRTQLEEAHTIIDELTNKLARESETNSNLMRENEKLRGELIIKAGDKEK